MLQNFSAFNLQIDSSGNKIKCLLRYDIIFVQMLFILIPGCSRWQRGSVERAAHMENSRTLAMTKATPVWEVENPQCNANAYHGERENARPKPFTDAAIRALFDRSKVSITPAYYTVYRSMRYANLRLIDPCRCPASTGIYIFLKTTQKEELEKLGYTYIDRRNFAIVIRRRTYFVTTNSI